MGHLLGGEKLNFKFAAEGALRSMAAAPVQSCQSLPKRCPWGRLGSPLYTCNRLHRIRCRFQHISANSLTNAAHKTMSARVSSARASAKSFSAFVNRASAESARFFSFAHASLTWSMDAPSALRISIEWRAVPLR